MTTKLRPERLNLALEAVQLRTFGWTQQQIAECLVISQQTVSYWLHFFGNGNTNNIVAKYPNKLTLLPISYENTDEHIAPESVDLIVTDPPYLVSSNNISRNNQKDLQRDFGEWDKIDDAKYAELKRG